MEDFDKLMENMNEYFQKREAEKSKLKNLLDFTEILLTEIEILRKSVADSKKALNELMNNNENTLCINEKYFSLKALVEKYENENLQYKNKLEEQQLLHIFEVDKINTELTEKLQEKENELEKLKNESEQKIATLHSELQLVRTGSTVHAERIKAEGERKLVDANRKNHELVAQIREMKLEMKHLKEKLQEKQDYENLLKCNAEDNNITNSTLEIESNVFSSSKYPPLNIEINSNSQISSIINNFNLNTSIQTVSENTILNTNNNQPPLFEINKNRFYKKEIKRIQKFKKTIPPLAECSDSIKSSENGAQSPPKKQKKRTRTLFEPDNLEAINKHFEVDE